MTYILVVINFLAGSTWGPSVTMTPTAGVKSCVALREAVAVVHQYLDAVGAFVGEQVRMVGVGSAEDGDHPGQRRVGSSPHVQRGGGQPGCVDAHHLRRAAVQLARSAAALRGQVTVMDSAPLRSSTLISCSWCTEVTGGNARAMNAGAGDGVSVTEGTQGLAS